MKAEIGDFGEKVDDLDHAGIEALTLIRSDIFLEVSINFNKTVPS